MNIEKIYKSKKYIILSIGLVILVLGCIFILNEKKYKVNVSGGILQEGIIPGYTE